MRTKGNVTITGILIIFGVIAYLAFIGNTALSSNMNAARQEVLAPEISPSDSIGKNPFSGIYQKVNLEKNKLKQELLQRKN